jgi:hypothetical protein
MPTYTPGSTGSDLEALVIGGIDVNNEDGPWRIHNGRLVNNPPLRRPEWIDSPDADGGVLASIPTLERQTIEVQIELVEQADMDEALDSLLDLIAVLDEAERLIPGQWVTRTPAETDRTRLTYCQLGEITNLPVEATGDLAGWLDARPVVQIRLECVPYWLGTFQVGPTVTNGDPIQTVDVEPEGNLPAFGFVRYTDTETADRSHVEIGADHTDDTARSYLIDSASLVTSGYAGSATTRTGAYSTNGVVRATLTTTPLVVCSTGKIEHVGGFKVRPRVYGDGSGTISVRVDHRNGDAPFSEGPWVEVPTEDAFYDLDGGAVELAEAPLGDQDAEIRIVAKSTLAGVTLDVDYVALLPTSAFYAVARGALSIDEPDQATAYDGFLQASGALTGKTLGSGQTWTVSTGSDTDDLSVLSANQTAYRSSGSDSGSGAFAGRLVTAGTSTYTNIAAGVSLQTPGLFGEGAGGPAIRVTDNDNALIALMSDSVLYVAKYVSAAVTILGELPLGTMTTPLRIGLIAFTSGRWLAQINDSTVLQGQDTDLATGGALATGKVGFGDRRTAAPSVATRYYDDFFAWVPTIQRALYSGRSLELQHDRALRESSDGTTWGRPPIHRGGFALLPPGMTTRVVAKARRNDVAELPDSVIDDTGTLSVDYLPRYSVTA